MAKKTEPEAVYAEIGSRIEKLREARGMSQSELSRRLKRCRLGRAAVSNIESGRQRLMLHVLLEIAEVLDIEPSSILSPGSAANRVSVQPLEESLASLGVSPENIAELHLKLRQGAES